MQLHHADPHDAIAAQLRALSTSHANDPSGPDVTPAVSPEPTNEPPLHATPLNDNAGDMRVPTSRARSGRKVVFLAICAGVAATMAWHVYGDQAKQRFSSLLPQFLTNTPAPTQSANAAEPQDAASQVAASQPAADAPAPAPTQENSNAASATTTPAVPTPATSAAEPPPTQAALPPEVTQSLETMAQEIASLKQTVEQLRAGQQQLSNDVARVNEQATHHKLTEQTPKPTSRQRPRHPSTPAVASHTPAALRTLAPTPPPQQTQSQRQIYPQVPAQREAYTPPPAPTRLPPPPGDSSVPRPPMPLQ